MPIRFVILATPRCGSNWLCSLLDSHPDILCHHELFNPEGIHLSRSLPSRRDIPGEMETRDAAPLAFLARAWNESFGQAAVGFKLNLGQSELVFDQVIDDPGVRKIILSRRNRIRSHVSEMIAEKTRIWESFPDSEPMVNPGPQVVDVAALFQQVRRNRDYYNDLRRRLEAAGAEILETEYENLGDPDEHRRLLNFLEMDPDVALTTTTSRMNRGSLRMLISNFDQLKRDLAGSDLLNDLIDGEEG